MLSTEEIQKQIDQIGLVAAIRCRAPLDVILEVGDALHAAPLTAVMISAGSVQPWQIVAEFRRRYGRSMAVGAGPLRTRQEVAAAIAVGAHFVMSASQDRVSSEMCRKEGVVYIPGVQEVVHLHHALDEGWRLVSYFPADRCGCQSLENLTRGSPEARILAAGGVDAANLGGFAKAGAAAVIVRGVFSVGTHWRMNEVILHMRRLRAAWDIATTSRD